MTVPRRGRRSRVALATVALVAVGATACTTNGSPSDPASPAGPPSTTAPQEKVELTLGVYGSPAETAPFRVVVDRYNQGATATSVTLETYADRPSLLATLETDEAPDVYLASRRDLDDIVAAGLNAPLLELLDERGVDYGDGYSRDALLSFSIEDDLQCMPYGISPEVVYYNADLIDFERMRQRELPSPAESLRGWSFAAFAAAADTATRPRRNTRGVYVEPTLAGLAPFVFSGNGSIFDDADEPTSLVLSDDGSREALTETLGLLRNPLLTLTDRQLQRRTPLEWFKSGKLGMILGTRALTPELRDVEGLNFDVMPMPMIGDQVTVGDITGLCIVAGNQNLARTADFLVEMIGDEAVALVARSGYLVPANLEVALSSDFLQPEQMPANANIFNTSVRDLRVSPLIEPDSEVSMAVAPQVRDLFTAPVLDDLDERTDLIDETSRSVLDPDYEPASPSPEASDPVSE